MKTFFKMAIGVATALLAGRATAGEYYYGDDYCPERVAYYSSVVHYHIEPLLTGYRTVARAYTVPVVYYKTYIRYHRVPVYTHVVYRTVDHYPVFEHDIVYDPDAIHERAHLYGCCD